MYRDFTKYEVFEDGKIWSYSHKKFLKPRTNNCGYQRVCLSDNDGNTKWYFVHKVVYEAVTGSPIPEGMQCNHINECKSDNRFCNINLLTQKENCNFGTRNKRSTKARSKQVGAFKNGELVLVFPSTQEAQRNGFSQSNISECCNGKLKTHKGYEWKYL